MHILSRKNLLLITALTEGAIGIGLVVIPSVVAGLLLGLGEMSQETGLFARTAGAALICIGLASWCSKEDSMKMSLRGQLAGLTVYNGVSALIFAYAGIALQMIGILLWPALISHAALMMWCIYCLQAKNSAGS